MKQKPFFYVCMYYGKYFLIFFKKSTKETKQTLYYHYKVCLFFLVDEIKEHLCEIGFAISLKSAVN